MTQSPTSEHPQPELPPTAPDTSRPDPPRQDPPQPEPSTREVPTPQLPRADSAERGAEAAPIAGGERRAAIYWQAWEAPKDGKSEDENEDAERVVEGDGGGSLCVAVADGATEAIYSRQWARALVAAASPEWAELDDEGLGARLDDVRRSFQPLSASANIPWFARDKYLLRGSQATLLVATLAAQPDGTALRVRAMGVGDSCLLVIRADGRVEAFPVQSAAAFGVHPALVRERAQPDLRYLRWETTVSHGDVVVACTDAVAAWCLGRVQQGRGSVVLDTLVELVEAGEVDRPAAPASAASDTAGDTPAGPSASAASGDGASSVSPGSSEDGTVAEGERRDEPLAGLLGDGPADGADLPQPSVSPTGSQGAYRQFLARARAATGQERMRNDDATLVLLVPVRRSAPDSRREALETLRAIQRNGELALLGPTESAAPAAQAQPADEPFQERS